MCWVCLALRKFRLNLLVFWLWVFLLKLKCFSFFHQISKGFCCLDWALCCSCLYVELQLLGCNVCCQVFPVFLTLNLPQWVTSVFLFQQGPDFVCQIFSEGSCCFGLSSVSFLPLCWASVAGLHCLLPSTSEYLSSNLSQGVTSVSWIAQIFL